MSAPVVIVGGGWAGLACAVELAAAGRAVELLEAAPQLGGRARSVAWGPWMVDNGQHLLIGAYRETLNLLQRTGVATDSVLWREPLRLEIYRAAGVLRLQAPPLLPAPLHLAWALWRGLSGAERRASLRFCLQSYRHGFTLPRDTSVAQLLNAQPPGLVRDLWEPLCLATLNTPIASASAQVFLRVLRDAFARRRSDSELLHPRLDLDRLLPQAAQRFVEGHGGHCRVGRRASELIVEGRRLRGVRSGGEILAAEHVVLATAPWHAARLLEPHAPLRALAARLLQLGQQPIATVYLAYPPGTTLGQAMQGFSGLLSQWVIDRGVVAGQDGLMAVVISGPGPHMDLGREELAGRVAAELAAQFPHWPASRSTLVLREKRATFDCSVASEPLRPPNATAVKGLWLAGDYTATGYPATLEGAVRSGVQCARQLLQQ